MPHTASRCAHAHPMLPRCIPGSSRTGRNALHLSPLQAASMRPARLVQARLGHSVLPPPAAVTPPPTIQAEMCVTREGHNLPNAWLQHSFIYSVF